MKNETKHAPGPWQTMNSHKAGFRNVVSLSDDMPENRKFIAEVSPSDTSFADAELMAAAPDLLFVCKMALNRLLGDCILHETNPIAKRLAEAIAKAQPNEKL